MKLGVPEANAELVRVARPEERIAVLEMCDEDGKNALSREFVGALVAALTDVGADASVHVVILRGLGDVFCSGASRALLEDIASSRVAPAELGLSRLLLELEVPVIAACEGSAVGGGFTLALAADCVVLAEERRYGFNFMSLGITPGMGTTTLARHFLGCATADELMLTGEMRRGRDFTGEGVRRAPSETVYEVAVGLALRMAESPRRALSLLKRSVTLSRRRSLVEGLTLESLMHETTIGDLDPSRRGGGR